MEALPPCKQIHFMSEPALRGFWATKRKQASIQDVAIGRSVHAPWIARAEGRIGHSIRASASFAIGVSLAHGVT